MITPTEMLARGHARRRTPNAKRARLPNQSAPRPLKDNSTCYCFAGEAVAAGLAAAVAAAVGVALLAAAFEGS